MAQSIKKKKNRKGQVFFTEFQLKKKKEFQLTKGEGMREAEKSPGGKHHGSNFCDASPLRLLN